jgi:hypothetical protein
MEFSITLTSVLAILRRDQLRGVLDSRRVLGTAARFCQSAVTMDTGLVWQSGSIKPCTEVELDRASLFGTVAHRWCQFQLFPSLSRVAFAVAHYSHTHSRTARTAQL